MKLAGFPITPVPKRPTSLSLVGKGRLELPRLSAHDPKSCSSTSSDTSPSGRPTIFSSDDPPADHSEILGAKCKSPSGTGRGIISDPMFPCPPINNRYGSRPHIRLFALLAFMPTSPLTGCARGWDSNIGVKFNGSFGGDTSWWSLLPPCRHAWEIRRN